MQAPALHLDAKSHLGPCDEARAIAAALYAARGTELALPVYFGRRRLGWALGKRNDCRVWWRPDRGPAREALPWSQYSDLRTNINNGRVWQQSFVKSPTGTNSLNAWYDLWPCGADPISGTYGGAALTSVQKSDTSTGAILHGGNVSPYIKVCTTLTVKSAGGTAPIMLLYDRVLTYEACTFSNANQNFVNSLAPQRYGSNGQIGLQIAVSAQTTIGATATNLTTLTYVDQDGNTGATMPTTTTIVFATSITAPDAVTPATLLAPQLSTAVTQGPLLPLALGDTGAQTLTNFTCSANNTGTICFILNQPLAWLSLPTGDKVYHMDYFLGQTAPAIILDGACLSFFYYDNGGVASTFYGTLKTVWG